MSKSFVEVCESMTGPGGPFELTTEQIRGHETRVFKNAPTSLRAIFDTARLRGDETFLVYEDERLSFSDVMARVDALSATLVERYGVVPGDRVAIGMRNYPEWVVAFAAITSVGAVSVSLNAWWTTEELDYALGDSGSKLVVADRERSEQLAALLDKHETRVICVRSETVPAGIDRWDDVVELGVAMPSVEIDPDMDATILYTSGTTGHPKGAVSTHRAVISALQSFACRAIVNVLLLDKPPATTPGNPTSFILIVPLFHVTGCIAVLMSCFTAGYKLVMMYKWDPARALELIERERITQFVGVPTQSWDLLECPDFAKRDTSSLASVGGGGAPAPPELVRRVDKSFKAGRPSIGYGMTETNAYGPGNSGDDYLRKPTSCGRVVPSVEMRVTNDDGKVLGVDEVGELWFKGANLIRGYWNRAEATAETIVDGWLRTGDIGRIDEEGFVYVQDRAKDMVLRAGENVYCAEVEAAIYEHAGVYEAAVFGLPHERLGEEVAVAIVPKPGSQLDEAELRSFLSEHLASFKIPTFVSLHDQQLPRNPAGKILKRDLRDAIVATREAAEARG